MSDQSQAGGQRRLGVVVVHGLGEASPGDVVRETTQPLSSAQDAPFSFADAFEVRDLAPIDRPDADPPLDALNPRPPETWAERLRWRRPVEPVAVDTFASVVREGRLEGRDGAADVDVLVTEVHWSDVKRGRPGELPPAFALINEILSGHFIFGALARGRDWFTFSFIFFVYLLSGLLRGPIVAASVFGLTLAYAAAVVGVLRRPGGLLADDGSSSVLAVPADVLSYALPLAALGVVGGLAIVASFWRRTRGQFYRTSARWTAAVILAVIAGMVVEWIALALSPDGLYGPGESQSSLFFTSETVNVLITASMRLLLLVYTFLSVSVIAAAGFLIIVLVLQLAIGAVGLISAPFGARAPLRAFAAMGGALRAMLLSLTLFTLQAVVWAIVIRPIWLGVSGDSIESTNNALTDAIPQFYKMITGIFEFAPFKSFEAELTLFQFQVELGLNITYGMIATFLASVTVIIALRFLIGRILRFWNALRGRLVLGVFFPRLVFSSWALALFLASNVVGVAVPFYFGLELLRAQQEAAGGGQEAGSQTSPGEIVCARPLDPDLTGDGASIFSPDRRSILLFNIDDEPENIEALRSIDGLARDLCIYDDFESVVIVWIQNNIIGHLLEILFSEGEQTAAPGASGDPNRAEAGPQIVLSDSIKEIDDRLYYGIAIFPRIALAPIITLAIPAVIFFLSLSLAYAAKVLEDITNYNGDPSDGRRRNWFPVRGLRQRERIQARFRAVIERLLPGPGRQQPVDRLLILSHSQGTIVAVDFADELLDRADACGVRVDLVTMGSPLRHIYSHYYPEYGDLDDRIRRLAARLDSWTNLYRINDPIGRRLTALNEKRREAAALGVIDVPLKPGRHRGYWSEPEVGARIITAAQTMARAV